MILGVSSLLSAFLSSEIKTEIIAQKRKEPNKITETVSELVNKCKIDRLPNVAEQQYSIGLTYDFNLASKPAFARFDLNHYGDSYATFAEDKEDMSPSYTKLNLNVGVELEENSYVQLSIDNLTDERTEAFRFSAESPGYRARNYLQWIPPRSISVQYRYGF